MNCAICGPDTDDLLGLPLDYAVENEQIDGKSVTFSFCGECFREIFIDLLNYYCEQTGMNNRMALEYWVTVRKKQNKPG